MTREEVESSIRAHQAILELMDANESELSLMQMAFIKYIEFEKIVEVAKYLRNACYRMPNGNSIQPTHISDILDSNPKDVSKGVQNIAKSIFHKNKNLAHKIWN